MPFETPNSVSDFSCSQPEQNLEVFTALILVPNIRLVAVGGWMYPAFRPVGLDCYIPNYTTNEGKSR